ncbi:S41 family peptidase [Alkaliphilus serpentinus]|uniref:S41 family peptidase n=1 Tax=Alkaliphilus serpentinus TaxID=1482731 RepID=A0A833M858_9FIRM|nr:S41 family peptidase [Alkaliphilus serpentinus]KAB3531867.1 S41 family peptidase [Alkaliphilus serpentinus]
MRQKFKQMAVVLVLVMALIATTIPFAYGQEYSEDLLEYLRKQIVKKYVDPITQEELVGDTPQEIFENLDVHSVFYTEEEFSDFLGGIQGEFAGIGVYIEEKDGKILVIEPIEGSPAHEAGIRSGDEIYTVDGKVIRDMVLDEAANLIKGEAGTEVKLGIKRKGSAKTLYFNITRVIFENNPISVEVIDGVGYISISMFNEKAHVNFTNAIGELLYEEGVKQLIVDLRNNPGGSLSEVVNISNLLVPRGPVLHIEYNNHKVTYTSFLKKPLFEDLVILVNEGSASASEILAGAVKDTQAGVLIGTKTYGKGSVQRIYPLMDGTGYKLTEARYLSPNYNVIDGIGVTPDYVIERYPEHINLEELLPIEFTSTISLNTTGDNVVALQQRLMGLGYEIEDNEGEYKEGTQRAVMDFAEDYNLEASEATPELIQELEYYFWLEVASPENDQQLNYALDYLKEKSAEKDEVVGEYCK